MSGRAPRATRAARLATAIGVALASATLLVGTDVRTAAAGPPAVMTGFVPLPADQMQGAFESINPLADPTLDFTVGITNASTGAIIYYDHWEDGYEADIANPVQPDSEVWGDNDPLNGDASSVCSTCTGDVLDAGDVFVMRNDITTPRNSSEIRWDGRDKVGSTRGFALTAGGFSIPLGSVLAGAVSAYDTSRYGTSFVVPVGQNTPVPVGATPPFEYTGASIGAAQDNTSIQVDPEDDGTFLPAQTINQGEALFVNGGLLEGARIVADKPVQVHVLTGDIGATYEAHFFTLFPTSLLSNSYINPVGSSTANQETIIYLFNPNPGAITITPTCTGCSGTIPIAAGTSASFTVPLGEGVRFDSGAGGPVFTAVGAMGSQSGAANGTLPPDDSSSTYDWGFTLVPADILTTQVVIGWAPGASNVPPSSATFDPVWATTFAATTLHVDYDGDPTTGSMSADCIGLHDDEIVVGALDSTKIVDTGDNAMTGARIYTCDGTAIAAAWGEDPSTAPVGSPGFDAGYTVIPTTTMLLNKSSSLAIDSSGDGKFGPGDTMQYSVSISNAGGASFTNLIVNDNLSPGLTYVPGSTTFDDGTTTIPITDDIPPALTAFPFDEGGAQVPDVPSGAVAIVRFRAGIDDPFPSSTPSMGNTVDVCSDQGCGTSSDLVPLASADLELSKVETASPQFVGQNAVFLVTVVNQGPDDAPLVEVADLLPANTTYQSHNASQGSYVPGSGVWTIGTIPNGASRTLEITARVDAPSVQNFAEITHSGAVDIDSQPAEDPLGPRNPPNQDDEDVATVVVTPSADLSLTKVRTAGPDVNGNTTFRVSVTNGGPSPASGIEVNDLPPAGATYVSDVPSQGSFDSLANHWVVGSLASGATATLDVTYTIPSFPATNFAEINVATVSDPDSDPAEDPFGPGHPPNEDDEDAVTVNVLADLELQKVETASPQFVGQDAVFDITITNQGPDPATSVQVADLLPAGLVHQANNPSVGTYNPGTGVWLVGTIASGDSETLSITARVTLPGTLTNTAQVSASGAPDPDSTPANSAPAEDDQDSAAVTTAGASLGDTVYFDINGDGTLDVGEPGIPGVGVRVTTAGPNGTLGDGDDVVLPTVTTDGSGAWTVTGLAPGPYRVDVITATLPSGMTDPTADLDGIATANTTDVTVSGGQNRTDVDFGYTGTATLGDFVFLDMNGDSLPGLDEGLSGVDVDVTWAGFDGILGNADDVSFAASTNADGQWTIGDLPAGPYRVVLDQATLPAGLTNHVDVDGGNDGASLVTLVAGSTDLNQDFGYLGSGALGRIVWRDDNRNSVPDPGEGLPGISVRVVWAGRDATFANADDIEMTDDTDSTGTYGAGNLPPGEFRVDVMTATLPSGATNTVDPDGNTDSTSQLVLAAGAVDLLQNFGYTFPLDATPTATTPLAFTGATIVQRGLLIGGVLLAFGGALVLTGRKLRARVA